MPNLLNAVIYLNLRISRMMGGFKPKKSSMGRGNIFQEIFFRTRHNIYRPFFIVFVVVIDAGSRYEVDYPSGLSHLLEKLAFQVPFPIAMCFCLLLRSLWYIFVLTHTAYLSILKTLKLSLYHFRVQLNFKAMMISCRSLKNLEAWQIVHHLGTVC